MTFDIHAVEPGDEGEMLSHPGDSTPMQVQQNEDERFLIPEGTAITLPAVAVAGLFSDICRRERTTGKSSDCSRRGASAAEGHLETGDHLQPGIAARPVGLPIAGSSSGAEARSGETRPGEASHPSVA